MCLCVKEERKKMQQYQAPFFANFPGMPQVPNPQPQQPQQQHQQHPMYQLPGNMFAGSVSPVPTTSTPQQAANPTHAGPSPLEEFEKLWAAVISRPNEFEYWEALVQYTSQIVNYTILILPFHLIKSNFL